MDTVIASYPFKQYELVLALGWTILIELIAVDFQNNSQRVKRGGQVNERTCSGPMGMMLSLERIVHPEVIRGS